MITVRNENTKKSAVYAANIEAGTAFTGTVDSRDCGEYTGLFVRAAETLVYLAEPEVAFDIFEEIDGEYSPEIQNFAEVNIEVIIVD
jgi:hypothetical protein